MSVPVYDSSGLLLEHVEPAVARHALKAGHATRRSDDPFSIQLARDLRRCPRPVARKDHTMFSNHNPAESLRRLRAILESKDDIWVKTIPDPTQKAMIQVSLDCTHLGQKYRVPPIQVGDPVNLMNYAPHEAWAANPDLRTQVQRGRLRLMTTEESDAHFTQKAALLGKSVNAVKNEALQAENDQVTHKPLSPTLPSKEEDVAPKFHSVKDGLERESTINPRVMQLCANAAKDVPVADRLAEGPLLFELQQMEPILSVEDLDYVMSFGNYKRVKDWARSAQKSKPDADDDKVEI